MLRGTYLQNFSSIRLIELEIWMRTDTHTDTHRLTHAGTSFLTFAIISYERSAISGMRSRLPPQKPTWIFWICNQIWASSSRSSSTACPIHSTGAKGERTKRGSGAKAQTQWGKVNFFLFTKRNLDAFWIGLKCVVKSWNLKCVASRCINALKIG